MSPLQSVGFCTAAPRSRGVSACTRWLPTLGVLKTPNACGESFCCCEVIKLRSELSQFLCYGARSRDQNEASNRHCGQCALAPRIQRIPGLSRSNSSSTSGLDSTWTLLVSNFQLPCKRVTSSGASQGRSAWRCGHCMLGEMSSKMPAGTPDASLVKVRVGILRR